VRVLRKKNESDRALTRSRSHSRSFSCGPSWDPRLTSVSRAGNQRPPDYELLMCLSTDLYRFVSLCTSLSCCEVIVKYSRDLYRFGGNTGAETGIKYNFVIGMFIQKVCDITQDSNNNDDLQFPFSQEHVYQIICLNNPLPYFQNIFLNQPGVLPL